METEWGGQQGKGAGQRVFTVLLSDWSRQCQAGRDEFNQRCASPAAVPSQQQASQILLEGGRLSPSLSPSPSLHAHLTKISSVEGAENNCESLFLSVCVIRWYIFKKHVEAFVPVDVRV